MKEDVMDFMREHWIDYLAEQQTMIWEWDSEGGTLNLDDRMDLFDCRHMVKDHLEYAEPNPENVHLHKIIWPYIQWQKVADETYKLAEIKWNKKEAK